MENKNKIKKIVGISVLLALVISLQLISNYITIGSISITLALIPIAMGAILYGPLTGMFLGIAMGIMVLVAPSTAIFFGVNAIYTIFICLFKSALAGFVAGMVFKGFIKLAKNNEKKTRFYYIGIITSSILVPIINTLAFVIGAPFGFKELFNNYKVVISAVFTTNFLIEFLVSAILSPSLNHLVRVLTKETNMGFNKDLDMFNNTN